MRTTVTLDDDVERRLRQAIRKLDLNFKEALNQAVSCGVDMMLAPPKAKPFKQKTFKLGMRKGFNMDKAMAIADALQDEDIVRKLYHGK